MIRIITEVLAILGIKTKEIGQGRISEKFSTSMSPLAEWCSEKRVNKLIGRTDLEDALNRLDKLTHEQAQMATTEAQKATLAIDETAGGVAEQVTAVDDRVVSDNDKIAEVINGAQIVISQALKRLI